MTAYEVFLSDFALRHFLDLRAARDALDARKRREDPAADLYKYDCVVPGKNPRSADEHGHVHIKSIGKPIYAQQKADKQMKGRAAAVGNLKLAGGRWSAHDLRRTDRL